MQQLTRVMRHGPIQQKFFSDSDDLTDLQDSCFTQLLQRMRVLSEVIETAVDAGTVPGTESDDADDANDTDKQEAAERVEELVAAKDKLRAEFKEALLAAEEDPESIDVYTEAQLAQELNYAEEDYKVIVSRGQADSKRGTAAKQRVDSLKALCAKRKEITAVDTELESARQLFDEAAEASAAEGASPKVDATWATPLVFETLEKLRLIAETEWEVTNASTERLNAEYEQTLHLLTQSTLDMAQKARGES